MTKEELSKQKSERMKNINLKKRQNTWQKIFETLRQMIREDKEITVFSVSKQSGLSFNTVKQYRDFIESWA